jgi:hypothetical protein
MKKATTNYTILAIIILILTQSCKENNECEGILCFTPPEPFRFELVDKWTGENLFTNGTFNSNAIKVINLDDQRNVEFTFINENDYNLIQLNTIGWKTETVTYSVQISNENIFNLYVIAERLTSKCCDYTDFKEIQIENSEFEFNEVAGIYKILVD